MAVVLINLQRLDRCDVMWWISLNRLWHSMTLLTDIGLCTRVLIIHSFAVAWQPHLTGWHYFNERMSSSVRTQTGAVSLIWRHSVKCKTNMLMFLSFILFYTGTGLILLSLSSNSRMWSTPRAEIRPSCVTWWIKGTQLMGCWGATWRMNILGLMLRRHSLTSACRTTTLHSNTQSPGTYLS